MKYLGLVLVHICFGCALAFVLAAHPAWAASISGTIGPSRAAVVTIACGSSDQGASTSTTSDTSGQSCNTLPAAAQMCLSPTGDSGQEVVINNLLSMGGMGTVVSLCPNTVFNLTYPIDFTAADQEISTAAYPTDPSRAMFVVTGAAQSMAIDGSCSGCSGIKLLNIQVNGNRPNLGRIAKGSALIEMGGQVSGQLVQYVHSFEPRGWSALHVFEGGLNCSGVEVLNNDIGPSGEPAGEWADGISYACSNGRVANNVVTDATDGGIVVFQAPGSTIENNKVIAMTRTLMGGINMVDYRPYSGNYSGTTVTNNVIDAQGAMIKVGLAIGPAVWANSTKVVYGGTVTNNLIKGNYLGYAVAVSGVKNFTVTNNMVSGNFSGQQDFFSETNTDPYPKCSASHPNPPAQPFLMNPRRSAGSFQGQDFAYSKSFKVLICLQPVLSSQVAHPANVEAAQSPPQNDPANQHTITVMFDYDFQNNPSCAEKPTLKTCIKQFVVYDISGQKFRLFAIPVPDGAREFVKGIKGESPKRIFLPGQHLIAVTAQNAEGVESQANAAKIMVEVKPKTADSTSP